MKPTDDGKIRAAESKDQNWLNEEPHRSRIERGLAWAAATAPAETDVELLVARAKPARGGEPGRPRA